MDMKAILAAEEEAEKEAKKEAKKEAEEEVLLFANSRVSRCFFVFLFFLFCSPYL